MRLIDADELKKELTRLNWNVECGFDKRPYLDDIIDNAPTVSFMISPDYVTELQNRNKELIKQLEEVERPQGEWKRHDEWRNGEYIGGFYHVNCPCEDGYYSKWETNFCPNCGADMRGDNNENND